MDGRAIKQIYVEHNGNNTPFENLVLRYQYLGDRVEAWAVQYDGAIEKARWNCKHIIGIVWA